MILQQNLKSFFFKKPILIFIFFVGNSLLAQVQNNEILYIGDNTSVYLSSNTYYFGAGLAQTKTTRTALTYGKLTFSSTATWSGASSSHFVDGYASTKGATAFVFPIGQSGVYAPAGVIPSSSAGVDGAYFRANPNTIGTTLDANVKAISLIEYWDIRGAVANAKISLTWRASSDITNLTLFEGTTISSLSNLALLGYDGTKWVLIPSTVDATSILGGISTLLEGSITSDAIVNLNSYSAFTLGSISTSNTTIISACDSYVWLVDGNTYTSSGNYSVVTGSHIDKLDLTITPSSDNVTIVSACNSYTWNGTTYTTSGIKTGTTTNCVTEKLDLTINTTVSPTGSALQTFCGSETVSLLNATGTGIVWYDAATLGIVVPNPTVLVDGTTYYASQTIDGCESTTRLAVTASVGACLDLENFDATNLQWYPNPTTGILNINYSKNIEEVSVINLLGQTLFTNKTKANEVQLDLSKLPTASYFVKVVSDGKSKIIKVIKQ
jgi:hypothetical protein